MVRAPRRPGKKARATPPKSKTLDRRLTAEPSVQPDADRSKVYVTPRDPQRELKEMPESGVVYGSTCHRCDQPVRMHIKATEGDFVLMNYYTAKCLCGGTLSMGLISVIPVKGK